MSGSREALIKSTCASSLGMDEHEEKPVDRIIAIAWANDPLGSLVLRAMAHDEQAKEMAIAFVARAIRKDCANISCSRVAASVLADILDQSCKACGGRGVIYSDKVARTCHHCNGTQMQDTRAQRRMVGGKQIPDELYSAAYRLYADSLARVSRVARQVLE